MSKDVWMWQVRDIDAGFKVMFQSASYDEVIAFAKDHPPKPGCGHEIICLNQEGRT